MVSLCAGKTQNNNANLSDKVLVLLYFFLFFMASTAFCFFVSCEFNQRATADGQRISDLVPWEIFSLSSAIPGSTIEAVRIMECRLAVSV